MGTGQTILTVGAIMLLMMVILRVNNSFLNTSTVMYESKYEILAASLASSIIEEAKGKAFDAATVAVDVENLNDLTAVGPGSGDIYPNFNDFDDYDGLVKIDSTMPSAKFKIKCEVDYINPSNPDVPVTPTKTWHKRMEVEVTSSLMADTVRLSTIYSYFYYR